MELYSAKRGLGKMAAILGILQGLTWTFLSLIAIILHYWKPGIDSATTYGTFIESMLYYKFIVDDGTAMLGITVSFIITPTNFNIIMWVYFVFSVLWCSLSFDQFTAIHYKKRRQFVVMKIWGMATLMMSAADLVFVLFLALDYATCAKEGSVDSGVTQIQYVCYTSSGIMLTLAARGFTLWLMNIAFSIILLNASEKTVREDVSNESLYSTIPRAKLASIPVYQQY